MFKNISLIFSVVALTISATLLFFQYTGKEDDLGTLSKRVDNLERDVDELFNRPSQGEKSDDLQNTLAFTVLREELEKMKKELASMRIDIVGGTAQKEAISNICQESQAHKWEDLASTLSPKFMSGFTRGVETLGLDEDTKESIISAYNNMLQDITDNQVAWMKGRIDATELSNRMSASALDFKSALDATVSPRLVKRILIIAFPDPAQRSQLFQGEKR